MKYIDADKIRAEIVRRMETCDATSKTPNQLLWAELSALLPFIDALEEPDKDLPLPEDTVLFNKGVAEGRRLEREDMLKDAVEGIVEYNFDRNLNGYYSIRPTYVEECVGEKVKIIIIKEDGE